mgnify:CR=1 FL=1
MCALKQCAKELPKPVKGFATLAMEILDSANPVLTLDAVKIWDYVHVARTHVTKYVKEVSIDYT